MGVPIAVTMLASGLVGFVIGRWWAVVVPLGGLTLFYVGLNVGWWGNGVGDAWQLAMGILMAAGVVAVVVGLAARAVVLGE